MSIGRELRSWVPRWWRGESRGWGLPLDVLLAPVELGFRGAVELKNTAYDHGVLTPARAPIPVFSVGNLTVGGSGKTPVAAWLAQRLRELGRRPAIALRGYGRDEIAVHEELNRTVPITTSRQRIRAVEAAANRGADCVILDDGFQHRRLARDLDIVLVSAEAWSGRRRMLPRGPFREPLGSLRRADHVLVTRKSAPYARADAVAGELMHRVPGVVVGCVAIEPTGMFPLNDPAAVPRPLGLLARRKVLAVTSLAEPAPFLEHLRDAGAIVDPLIFPDHYPFSASDAAAIARSAGERPVLMTRKEWVKLRHSFPPGPEALVVTQQVSFDRGRSELEDSIERVLNG